MTVTTPDAKGVPRAPVWPVLIAPFVALIYYGALKSAFSISIVSALGDDATADILEKGTWGSHWVYRLVAEILSVGLGTFVAAGLARHRERAAAIIGGLTIALGFILFWLAFLMFRESYTALVGLNLENYTPEANTFAMWIFVFTMVITVGLLNLNPAAEPWYQHVIEGLIIIASPFIGVYISQFAQTLNEKHPFGFVGINRLHLIWLWFAYILLCTRADRANFSPTHATPRCRRPLDRNSNWHPHDCYSCDYVACPRLLRACPAFRSQGQQATFRYAQLARSYCAGPRLHDYRCNSVRNS
jgi:hypothetical protein